MTELVRMLSFAPDGVPPCGRELVRVGRLAVVACGVDELAALPDGCLVWSPTEPVPPAVPALDASEQDLVSASSLAALTRQRPRDGETWDSPGAMPP